MLKSEDVPRGKPLSNTTSKPLPLFWCSSAVPKSRTSRGSMRVCVAGEKSTLLVDFCLSLSAHLPLLVRFSLPVTVHQRCPCFSGRHTSVLCPCVRLHVSDRGGGVGSVKCITDVSPGPPPPPSNDFAIFSYQGHTISMRYARALCD